MGRARKERRNKLKGEQPMHHATSKHDHYHAVADTHWRGENEALFAQEHCPTSTVTRAFEVTHEPVAESSQPMPPEIASEYARLIELAQLASPAAVARLEMLANRHPGVCVLNNLLAAAYSRAGRMKDALAVVEKNYQQAPEYLFSRVQYAQLCLAAGNLDAVSAIFDHHFDLKLLYPHRTQYHISEFVAFAAVVGEFHLLKGDYKSAESYCRTLQHMAPEHELTSRLQRLMGDGE